MDIQETERQVADSVYCVMWIDERYNHTLCNVYKYKSEADDFVSSMCLVDDNNYYVEEWPVIETTISESEGTELPTDDS